MTESDERERKDTHRERERRERELCARSAMDSIAERMSEYDRVIYSYEAPDRRLDAPANSTGAHRQPSDCRATARTSTQDTTQPRIRSTAIADLPMADCRSLLVTIGRHSRSLIIALLGVVLSLWLFVCQCVLCVCGVCVSTTRSGQQN